MTSKCACACHVTGPRSPSCRDCESRHYMYRYKITGISGDAPVGVGAVVVETQWMGRSHTWTILNRNTGELVGTFSGKYLGQREQDDCL